MVRGSTASSSSEDDDGGRAICIWVMGMMIITGAITGGVVSSWPPLDPSKDYTDRTVRESIVSDVQTSYVYLDDQFHSRQIQARRQLPSDSASKAPTGDAISIVPLTHNMELVSYCYTESKQLVRCDLYFNNPDKFEYWKDADQCLAYTIGAPKTTSQDHHCSFYPNDKSSDNKESPCIKSNQTPLNICEQQINWNSTTCFKFNDAPIFSDTIDLKNTRYTDFTYFQAVKVISPQDYPILQEMVLDRSMLVLHSTTSSNEDKISKRDEIKTAVICSNGAPGNGPKQNYKPVEVASIDETKSSISGNETASSSNA